MKPTTIEEYINAAPQEAKDRSRQVRKLILEAAPQAKEKLSYGMPYYSYKGRLVYWGAYKDYIGLYVMSARDVLAKEVESYRKHKATLHFLHSEPLPINLIKKIVKTQIKLNDSKVSRVKS